MSHSKRNRSIKVRVKILVGFFCNNTLKGKKWTQDIKSFP